MCEVVCGQKAHILGPEGHTLNREKCTVCGACAAVCAEDALEVVGYEIDEKELIKFLSRDKAFYEETGGGVTFTGGEPMMQAADLKRAAVLCVAEGIHVAVETASLAPWKNFKKVDPCIDLFICDLKAVTGELHKMGTGADNRLILENLKKLMDIRADRMWVRIPLIAGFNDSEAEFSKIAEFLAGRGVARVEIMPYHDVGISKYGALGVGYPLKNDGIVEKNHIELLKKTLRDAGVEHVV